MASKTKIEKLRNVLIDRYGDRVIIKFLDADNGQTLHVLRLSEVYLGCTADINAITDMCKRKTVIERHVNREEFMRLLNTNKNND